MLRNMVTTLLDLEQIETTDAKAKEARSLAEKMITLGKRGGDDLAARRQALRVIRSKKVVAKLFDELGPRYADRPGGYTRIVKVENRRGDGAHLSILAMVKEPVTFKDMKHKRAMLEEEAKLSAESERKVEEEPVETPEEVEAVEGETPEVDEAPAADDTTDEGKADTAEPEAPADDEPEKKED
jgi:large subunit ribosomal protein L17